MTSHPVNTHPPSGPRSSGPGDLESQLAKVVERDGALMHTPRGVTRKARAHRSVEGIQAKEAKIDGFLSGVQDETVGTRDEIAVFDHAALALVIAPEKIERRRDVRVLFGEHEASKYVVSLQRLAMAEVPDARVHVDDAARSFSGPVHSHALPLGVYASMGHDLSGHDMDPRHVHEQFTPEVFEEAYDQVYGRFDAVGSFARETLSIVIGWFHRIERVEKEVAADVGTALTLVDVPRFSLARAAVGFAALALVVTLPANALSFYRSAAESKEATLALGAEAVAQAKSAGSAGSIGASAETLKQASARFREADEALGSANAMAIGIASALPDKYRAARAMLEAGEKASSAAGLLATGMDKVFGETGRRLDERLDVLGAYARSALGLLSEASKAVATVDESDVPSEQRGELKTLREALDAGNQALIDFSSLADALSAMVGKDGARNYLLIFQNQTELRPTGGFMGSFAEVAMDRGEIQKINVPTGGTYDLQGQLKARVAPPKPLYLVKAQWQFQDSNWNPDFPSSAEKIRWFWSKSGQPTIDGVVAINASMVQKLLDVTGPIEMPEYGKTITADNFLLETQKAVELEYDKEENAPKKIIGDLQKKMLERAKTFSKDDWMKVAVILARALDTKDVQIAFSRPEEEALAERFGWSSRMKPTVGDSLAVIYANIAGQKTDAVIEEKVDHKVEIDGSGSIRDTVKITRTHTGAKGQLFQGVRNVGYLRVYVPKGSRLVSASGFNTPEAKWFDPVDETTFPDPDIRAVEATAVDGPGGTSVAIDGERTVFGGWVQLDPGHTQDIVLSYVLPFKASDILSKIEASPDAPVSSRGAYLLLLTSQSGKQDREIRTSVNLPKDWDISWSRAGSGKVDGIGYTGAWDRDIVLAALINPHVQEQKDN